MLKKMSEVLNISKKVNLESIAKNTAVSFYLRYVFRKVLYIAEFFK